MKLPIYIFLILVATLRGQEMPIIANDHAFPDGLAATEVYRLDDVVLVSVCLHDEWSVQISTRSKNFTFISYSKSYPVGGGGIYRLFSGDYDKDGKIELMACLYNGGRSGAGANQNQIIFFLISGTDIKIRATAWIEDFDPSKGSDYFKKSQAISGPNDLDELRKNNGA